MRTRTLSGADVVESTLGDVRFVPSPRVLGAWSRDLWALWKPGIAAATGLTALAGYGAAGGRELAVLAPSLFAVVFLAAGGAAAWNHAFEAETDRRVPATRDRPIAAGRRSIATGLVWGAVSQLVGTWWCHQRFGALAAILLVAGAWCYALLYTLWLKPRHWTAVPIGGLAGVAAWAVGATAAGAWPTSWILGALTLWLWNGPHFWSLAWRRRERYHLLGVPTLAACLRESTLARLLAALTVLVGLGVALATPRLGFWAFPAWGGWTTMALPALGWLRGTPRAGGLFAGSCLFLVGWLAAWIGAGW